MKSLFLVEEMQLKKRKICVFLIFFFFFYKREARGSKQFEGMYEQSCIASVVL